MHESLQNDRCNYVDPVTCDNLNQTGYNLIVLQLKIRSILKHVTELKTLLNVLERRNSTVDLVLLCETFLMKETKKLVDIPNYTLISNHRVNSKGGGMAILLRTGIKFTHRKRLEVFDEKLLETTVIELVAKNGKKIIVGSMYQPPNTNADQFNKKLNDLISKFRLEP